MVIFFDLFLNISADVIETGIIHNALASFTVVATSSACGPYLLAAPTTELVSCIANAHQRPNCVCDKLKWRPITGNIKSAMEFKMNTQPSATDICFSSALITGEMAAMALPPQIAVPDEIRCDVFRSILNHLPKK